MPRKHGCEKVTRLRRLAHSCHERRLPKVKSHQPTSTSPESTMNALNARIGELLDTLLTAAVCVSSVSIVLAIVSGA
jgi:hypothetical protein